jgi:hypothetical protein
LIRFLGGRLSKPYPFSDNQNINKKNPSQEIRSIFKTVTDDMIKAPIA